jgi:heme o synthase
VRAKGAGLAFTDWPLMDGKLVPALGGANTAMFAHRVLAALVFVLVLYVVVRARTISPRSPLIVRLAEILAALFVAQIAVGAAQVWTHLRPWAVVTHVGLSVVIWATVVTLATVAGGAGIPVRRDPVSDDARSEPAAASSEASLKDRLTAYYHLTKPEIIFLLLVTTVPAMMLAQHGVPPLGLILATLVGGTLAAGSANAINQYLDRDIDEVMRRTRRRPLPASAVTPEDALRFGFVLGAISFFFLAITVNVLAAELALSAIAFYVFVYTMWLKRTTTQNIVIGGAAGAVPALVGWAAVTGGLAAPAWVLFAIIFVWTPPHFWALAMRYRGDYAAAGVPMLPVVRGGDQEADLPLFPGAVRDHARPDPGGGDGGDLRGDGDRPGRFVRLPGPAVVADRRPRSIVGPVQVLDLVPRGTVRRRRAGRTDALVPMRLQRPDAGGSSGRGRGCHRSGR